MARLELSPDAERDLVDAGADISARSGSRETARRFLRESWRCVTCSPRIPRWGSFVLNSPAAATEVSPWATTSFTFSRQSTACASRILHGARDHGESWDELENIEPCPNTFSPSTRAPPRAGRSFSIMPDGSSPPPRRSFRRSCRPRASSSTTPRRFGPRSSQRPARPWQGPRWGPAIWRRSA